MIHDLRVFFVLLLSGCGVGQVGGLEAGAPDTNADAASVAVDGGSQGVMSIRYNGVELLMAHYIIGACDDIDDPNKNVVSFPSDGHTLHAPGSCPGAPFSIRVSGTNPYRFSVSVGPLPVTYASLSVPMDLVKTEFDSFGHSASSYRVGCANSWSGRSGSGGAYGSIPQPCVIPGHGAVGAARVTTVPAGTFGEAAGAHARIRRTYLGGNARELLFYNHPYTNNIEFSFVRPGERLAAGTTYTLEEEVTIADPAAPPPPPPPPAACDAAHPSPDWGEKDGQCLRSCGGLGGDYCGSSSCPSGYAGVPGGPSYDCDACCYQDDAPPPPPPPPNEPTCDPHAQPSPDWGEKDGQCLRSCGQLGGDTCSGSSTCPSGTTSVGESWDCAACCLTDSTPPPPPEPTCDPHTQPYPDWKEKDGVCLRSCGQLGGDHCSASSCPTGTTPVGDSWDCAACCLTGSPPSSGCTSSQPSPDWGEKDGVCLRSCGQLGGTWCNEQGASCPAGFAPVGESYDCVACCAP
jgi:hypothetical protein